MTPDLFREIVSGALAEASRMNSSAVEPVHLFCAALSAAPAGLERALSGLGTDPNEVAARARALLVASTTSSPDDPSTISKYTLAVLDTAGTLARRGVSPADAVAWAALDARDARLEATLERLNLSPAKLRDELGTRGVANEPAPVRTLSLGSPPRSAPAPMDVERLLAYLSLQLNARGIELRVAPEAIAVLARRSESARALGLSASHIVHEHVERPVEAMEAGRRIRTGAVVLVGVAHDEITVRPAQTGQGATAEMGIAPDAVLRTDLREATKVDVAMLLVDVVRSTNALLTRGETAFVLGIDALGRMILTCRSATALRFLKCTGDGFLAIYADAASAIGTARALLKVSSTTGFELRCVVHAGVIRAGTGGEPLGVEVHRLFRVEAISERDRAPGSAGDPCLPESGYLIVTDVGYERLCETERVGLHRLGRFVIRSFDEPENLWVELQEASSR
jgi:class 3 adenylate cyclase